MWYCTFWVAPWCVFASERAEPLKAPDLRVHSKCCQSSKFKMLGWTQPPESWALLIKKTCLIIRKTVLPEVVHKGNPKSSILWTVSKSGANLVDCTHRNCVRGQQLDLQIYITHTQNRRSYKMFGNSTCFELASVSAVCWTAYDWSYRKSKLLFLMYLLLD